MRTVGTKTHWRCLEGDLEYRDFLSLAGLALQLRKVTEFRSEYYLACLLWLIHFCCLLPFSGDLQFTFMWKNQNDSVKNLDGMGLLMEVLGLSVGRRKTKKRAPHPKPSTQDLFFGCFCFASGFEIGSHCVPLNGLELTV